MWKKYSLDIIEIDLNSKKLLEIPKNINKFSNLQRLNLSSNQIIEIKEDTFKSLTNLRELSLGNNKITEIKENTFKSLTSLQTLHLCDNQMTEIKEDTFKSLISLKCLYIDNNKMTDLKEDTFKSLTNLQRLNLSHNKITNLPLSILNCRRLETLEINRNEMTLDIRIQRFINRMRNYNSHGIFKDSQNVHSSSIQKSTQDSINNLTKDDFDLSKDKIVEQLIELKPKCLTDLLCYLDDKDVHSFLLLTFYEVFVKVFGRIINS